MSDETNTAEGQNNTETNAVGSTEGTEGESLLTDQTNTPEPPSEGEGSNNDQGAKEPPKDKKDEVQGAPEKYEEFKVPEGITLEGSMLENFSKTAKELNLPQEKAQKLIDLAVANTLQLNKQSQDHFTKVRQQWVSELKKDEEFGGSNFKDTVVNAQRVIQKFGTKELRTYLNNSGAGDNNELVKLFARIGKAMGEDFSVDGSPTNRTPKTAAEVLYPNHN